MAILDLWHFLKFRVWADAIFRHIPPLFDLCLPQALISSKFMHIKIMYIKVLFIFLFEGLKDGADLATP